MGRAGSIYAIRIDRSRFRTYHPAAWLKAEGQFSAVPGKEHGLSIVVKDLCRNFGTLRAVADVSFEIPPRTIAGLIGPNGAGKSTILRILSTFLRPASGSVAVDGIDAVVDPAGVRQAIGYLPENPPGYGDARIDEYLWFRAGLKGISRAARRTEIDRCLEACDLTKVRRRLIGRLSQGFRRRLGLADALLGRPCVMILDEPTIGLDPLQVRQTRELLIEAARESTILVSTHILAEAQMLCERALVLVNGRLLSDVEMKHLSGSLEEHFVQTAAPVHREAA
jgi:ABC-2 type transport system ATP-binding protein